MNEETKKKISESMKNHIVSEETRIKIKNSLNKNEPWNKSKHLSEEHKRKIGEANAKKMKEYWKNNNATNKQKMILTSEYKIQRKEKLGYINSPETRKIISKRQKEKWEDGRISEKVKEIFAQQRRGKNWKGKHHSEETKIKIGKVTKESRKKQIFPKKDTSIEVKIQNFLKELNIEFLTHQYMNIKHGYQCDILIPSKNLVIECFGDYWHKIPYGNPLDSIRCQELREKGYRVLVFWEREIKVMELNDFKNII